MLELTSGGGGTGIGGNGDPAVLDNGGGRSEMLRGAGEDSTGARFGSGHREGATAFGSGKREAVMAGFGAGKRELAMAGLGGGKRDTSAGFGAGKREPGFGGGSLGNLEAASGDRDARCVGSGGGTLRTSGPDRSDSNEATCGAGFLGGPAPAVSPGPNDDCPNGVSGGGNCDRPGRSDALRADGGSGMALRCIEGRGGGGGSGARACGPSGDGAARLALKNPNRSGMAGRS